MEQSLPGPKNGAEDWRFRIQKMLCIRGKHMLAFRCCLSTKSREDGMSSLFMHGKQISRQLFVFSTMRMLRNKCYAVTLLNEVRLQLDLSTLWLHWKGGRQF